MRSDPHSYASDVQPRSASFNWTAAVDFSSRTLRATVEHHLKAPVEADTSWDLDTRALSIEAVHNDQQRPLQFKAHTPEAVLGSRLEIQLPKGTRSVTITYRTSPEASALQWLTPAQTLGGHAPYLFSQCQAIHARSIVPCQDTPAFRVTYRATLRVPKKLKAVMAAASLGRTEDGEEAVDRFEMPQPIPPYLFAFAVGALESRNISSRCRVYAEAGEIEAAAAEFSGVEAMITAAEKLFGPYDWDRFDMLVMPPSFPYGGMENPRLTFLTPALITGDKSLVNVVAHELAHSWTGNLVTNANAEHMWLNEGFTVFAERRILEALEGPELTALHAAIGFAHLEDAVREFEKDPNLSRLRPRLQGVDPDAAFSAIPYEKGYAFLRTIEEAVGRSTFDGLLKEWVGSHRFGVANTDEFVAFLNARVPAAAKTVQVEKWINEPGIPANAVRPSSPRLERVMSMKGRVPTRDETKEWSITEWQLYLERAPKPWTKEACAELDARFSLTASRNPDVLVTWLVLACESGFDVVLPKVEEVLNRYGRAKYLKPLYGALHRRPETKDRAVAIFRRNYERYHPIAQHVITGLLSTNVS